MIFVQTSHHQQKKIGIHKYVVVILMENVIPAKVIVVAGYIFNKISQIYFIILLMVLFLMVNNVVVQ